MVQTRHGSAGAAPFFAVSPAERRLRFVPSDVRLEEEPSVCRSEPRKKLLVSSALCRARSSRGRLTRFPLAGFKVSDGDASDSCSFSALSLSPSLFCYCLEIMSSEEQTQAAAPPDASFNIFHQTSL